MNDRRRAFLLWTALILATSAAAETTSGGWGLRSPYQSLYRSGSPERIEGKVLSTEEFRPFDDMEPGVLVHLRSENGEIDVHLGPRWFVFQRDLTFTRGEPLVVMGMSIRLGGKPAVIADRIQRRESTTVLRELSGRPAWVLLKSHQIPE